MKDLSVGSSLKSSVETSSGQAMKLRHPDLVDISEGLVPFNHLGNLRPFAVENSGKPIPMVGNQMREIGSSLVISLEHSGQITVWCCIKNE